MNFRRLREIRRLMELTRTLQEFRRIMRVVDENRRQLELRKWYRSHEALIRSLSPDEMRQLGERVEYDEAEWMRIVAELEKDEN